MACDLSSTGSGQPHINGVRFVAPPFPLPTHMGSFLIAHDFRSHFVGSRAGWLKGQGREDGREGLQIQGVEGFRGSGVQGFRGSGVHGFRGSGVQGFRGSGVQG